MVMMAVQERVDPIPRLQVSTIEDLAAASVLPVYLPVALLTNVDHLLLRLALRGPKRYSAMWWPRGEDDALCVATGMERRSLMPEYQALPDAQHGTSRWPFRVADQAGRRLVIAMLPDAAVKLELAGSAARAYERWVAALARVPARGVSRNASW
jgi:hypothetical protein